MTDRPILFSGPMVRALVEGRKTQTRRIFKPQPEDAGDGYSRINGHLGSTDFLMREIAPKHWARIKAGDRLWVKETWRAHGWHADCVEIAYAAQRGLVGWSEQHEQISYPKGDRNAFKYYAPKGPDFWRPSLFMPRWASRLTLTVADVRVERLQEISEEDAIAEGIEAKKICGVGNVWTHYGNPHAPVGWTDPRQSYQTLWDSINGDGAWEANPWVAAYTFRVIRQNIDEAGR